MPNHLHGTILIHTPELVGAGLVPAHATRATTFTKRATTFTKRATTFTKRATTRVAPTGTETMRVAPTGTEAVRVAPTIGKIVGAFKSITTHKYIQGVDEFGWPVFYKRLWQRNYYEHIIRDEADHECIAGYIRDNPVNWDWDEENPQNLARSGNDPAREAPAGYLPIPKAPVSQWRRTGRCPSLLAATSMN